MAKRGSFLFRTNDETLDALTRWAGDELRSVNSQLEFIVRRALLDAGRLGTPKDPDAQETDE